jgi:chromosome segregation ATPase
MNELQKKLLEGQIASVDSRIERLEEYLTRALDAVSEYTADIKALRQERAVLSEGVDK